MNKSAIISRVSRMAAACALVACMFAMAPSAYAATVEVQAGADAVTIQRLLDGAIDGEATTVIIPAGTYNLDRSLFVHPNTTIKADANARMVKTWKYGAIIEAKLTKGKDGYNGSGYNGNHDITIIGGIWDSSPTMKSGGDGTETFRFIHCNKINISNATFCNVPNGSHHIVFAGVKDSSIKDCIFYGYENWNSKSASPKEAVQLDTCHSEKEVPTLQPSEITWDNLSCDGITVSGCEFYYFPRAVGSHTAVAGKPHTNVTISNNKIHDVSEAAIKVFNYQDSKITGNTITNAALGILVYTKLEDDKVPGEYYFPNSSAKYPASFNIEVANNTITNITDAKGVWGDGIRVAGVSNIPMTGVTVKGNKITNAQRYGIFGTYAQKCTIGSGNTITTTKKADGILLDSNSNASTVTGNTVTGAKKAGIAVYSSKSVNVLSNKVDKAGEDGIRLYTASSCTVGKSKQGNTITKCKANGINLSTVAANKGGCPKCTVSYNTVKTPGKCGIMAFKSTNATVQGNTITGAADCGISLSTNSTGAKVVSNTVKSSGSYGISLTSGCKASTVKKNTVSTYSTKKKNMAGIYVYKSGGKSAKAKTVITTNTVTGSGTAKVKDGIKVSESPFTALTSNKVKKAPGNGVYVYKSKNSTVTKNTVTSAKARGISLSNSPKGSVKNNTVSGVAKTKAIVIVSSAGTVESGNKVK